jgi:hypothetical protein
MTPVCIQFAAEGFTDLPGGSPAKFTAGRVNGCQKHRHEPTGRYVAPQVSVDLPEQVRQRGHLDRTCAEPSACRRHEHRRGYPVI